MYGFNIPNSEMKLIYDNWDDGCKVCVKRNLQLTGYGHVSMYYERFLGVLGSVRSRMPSKNVSQFKWSKFCSDIESPDLGCWHNRFIAKFE